MSTIAIANEKKYIFSIEIKAFHPIKTAAVVMHIYISLN